MVVNLYIHIYWFVNHEQILLIILMLICKKTRNVASGVGWVGGCCVKNGKLTYKKLIRIKTVVKFDIKNKNLETLYITTHYPFPVLKNSYSSYIQLRSWHLIKIINRKKWKYFQLQQYGTNVIFQINSNKKNLCITNFSLDFHPCPFLKISSQVLFFKF